MVTQSQNKMSIVHCSVQRLLELERMLHGHSYIGLQVMLLLAVLATPKQKMTG